MTGTTTPKPTKPSRSALAEQSAEDPKTRRAMIIIGALLGAAAIVALIIALASGGDDEPETGAAESARIPAGSLRQVSSAEVTGDPLPVYDVTIPDPGVGAGAPDITASYFDNEEVTIKTDDGTPRVMLFLAHWCPHCQREVKTLVPWFFDNGVPSDVEVVAVSTGVDEGAPNYPPSAWFRSEGWPIPVLRDSAQSDLARAYGLSGYPYIVAIDGDGNVVSRSSGEISIDAWQALLDSLRASTGASS